jgi:hypothetical protein
MNNIQDENYKKALLELIAQPGVMDHGRQPMDIIVREKYMASFHIYITTILEVDCITVRESLATGCIPLLSNYGVLKDREGVHFDLALQDPKCYINIATKIMQLVRQGNLLDVYRSQYQASKLLVTWKDVAEMWLKELA